MSGCWPARSGCWTRRRCGWDPSATSTRTARSGSPPCSVASREGRRWRHRAAELSGEERAGLELRAPRSRPCGAHRRAHAAREARAVAGLARRRESGIRSVPPRSTLTCVGAPAGPFSAKDFRTLRGTAAAALSLARSGPQATKAARRRAIAAAVAAAAEVLENTPAIARSSYVDPRFIDRYEHGETIDASRPRSVEAQLRVLLSS